MTADDAKKRIVIKVAAPDKTDGRLTVNDALQQVLDFLRVAVDAKTALGRVHEDFEWVLESATTNSPLTVVATAEPLNPHVDISAYVADVEDMTARAFRDVKSGSRPPSWLSPKGGAALREFFRRNTNGISATIIDFDSRDHLEITKEEAIGVLPDVEFFQVKETIPARTAYGEIEGRLAAVGTYYKKPALFLRTVLYGDVWCILASHLVDQWGDAQRVSDIWKSKKLTVYGRLIYWQGGKLARIEAEAVRERSAPPLNIEDLFDVDFTAGLDPVEYLDRLHEGKLG